MYYTDACICQDSAQNLDLPPASVQPEPEVLPASCPLTGAPSTTPVLSDGEPDKCMGAQGTEPETEPKVPEGVISDPQEGVSGPLISR